MIVWFNCKITTLEEFETAKQCFSSFASAPLISKIIFNLETVNQLAMEEHIKQEFTSASISLYWHQCTCIEQWQAVQEEISRIDDQVIFPISTADLLFVGNRALVSNIIRYITQNPYDRVVSACDVSESITTIPKGTNESNRIMHKEFFNWYLSQVTDRNMTIRKTEDWDSLTLPKNIFRTMFKPTFKRIAQTQ